MCHNLRSIIYDPFRYTRSHVWVNLETGHGGIMPYIIPREEMQTNNAKVLFRPISASTRKVNISDVIASAHCTDRHFVGVSNQILSPVNGILEWISPEIYIQDYNYPLFLLAFNKLKYISLMTYWDYMSHISCL